MNDEQQYWVNVYKVSRAYGGPEEGGWFYDCGEFQFAVHSFATYDDAAKMADIVRRRINEGGFDRIKASCKKNQSGFGPMDGVNPHTMEGDDNYLFEGGPWGDEQVKVYVQEHKGEDFPQERPYYE